MRALAPFVLPLLAFLTLAATPAPAPAHAILSELDFSAARFDGLPNRQIASWPGRSTQPVDGLRWWGSPFHLFEGEDRFIDPMYDPRAAGDYAIAYVPERAGTDLSPRSASTVEPRWTQPVDGRRWWDGNPLRGWERNGLWLDGDPLRGWERDGSWLDGSMSRVTWPAFDEMTNDWSFGALQRPHTGGTIGRETPEYGSTAHLPAELGVLGPHTMPYRLALGALARPHGAPLNLLAPALEVPALALVSRKGAMDPPPVPLPPAAGLLFLGMTAFSALRRRLTAAAVKA